MIRRRRPVIRQRRPLRRVGRARKRELAELVEFRRLVQVNAAGYCEGKEFGICKRYSHFGSMAHHLVPKGRGGSNDPENGVWLCFDGHRWVHDYPAIASELGLLRSNPLPVKPMLHQVDYWGQR